MEPPADSKPALKQCSACQVSFETDDVRRTHSKSSWHVENLRRRVAGQDPIPASAPLPPSPTPDSKQKSSKRGKSTRPPPVSSSSSASDSDTPPPPPPPFLPTHCLFCPTTSPSLPANLTHMHQSHGLFIPSPEHLIVDLETLLRYLHLVIFQYRECLSCHSQRRTPEAAQQHMLGKAHCKFDIDRPGSEYRDFYDFSAAAEAQASSRPGPAGQQESAHLPSGRVVASRTAPQVRVPVKTHEASEPATQPSTSTPLESTGAAPSSLELTTRVAKREDLLASQLSRLGVSDRMSLAHLSTSQQLALISTQQKQADAEKRKEKRLRTRVEFLDQKTVPKAISNGLPWTDNRYPGR
ncbi:cytoplasmic 60S subunit biogenesis factor REI1-like protein 2 [Podospora conica]|nr:cytoplasmic 60S subunit biogenesis factor REI1-like protein 2 [Schizothecium conicum]